MIPLIFTSFATCVMVGVIWFVQIVHYPLLAIFGVDHAPAVAKQHQTRTGYVVGAPMAVEGVGTLWLLASRPEGVALVLPWISAGFLAVALGCTVLLSVPLHEKMANNTDPVVGKLVGRRLVLTNWPRTIAWTLRAVLLLVMLVQAT